MAELHAKQRDKLKDSQFAYVDKDGERHLPLNDESHVRNAMARFNQTDFDSGADRKKAAGKIVRAAHRDHVEVDSGDTVAKAAKSR
jgi:hypothetical protein